MNSIIWKKIDSEPNYEISSGGKIRNSKTLRELRTIKRGVRGGYESIKIKNRHYLIHRLVAESFLKKVDGKQLVDHIDRNKFNNNLSNLRWVDRAENFINSNSGDRSSKFTGIIFDDSINKWVVYIKGNLGLKVVCESMGEAYSNLVNILNKQT